MKRQNRETLDAYYADAASWNRDRLQGLRAAHRAAWWVAVAAVAVALLEGLALVLLTPLKTVEPYTLLVDRTTGYVQALKPLDPGKISPDTALTQSLLVQYVIAREGFDVDTVDTNYRKVALLSADRARSSYLGQMQASNPQSPLIAYPRGTVVETQVKSVSPMGKDVALVRFDTVRTNQGAQVQLRSAWIAVIHYRYSGEPLKLEDRFVNPLGFQVISYRRDQEAIPQLAEQSTGSATMGNSSKLSPGLSPTANPAMAQPEPSQL